MALLNRIHFVRNNLNCSVAELLNRPLPENQFAHTRIYIIRYLSSHITISSRTSLLKLSYSHTKDNLMVMFSCSFSKPRCQKHTLKTQSSSNLLSYHLKVQWLEAAVILVRTPALEAAAPISTEAAWYSYSSRISLSCALQSAISFFLLFWNLIRSVSSSKRPGSFNALSIWFLGHLQTCIHLLWHN